MLGQFIVGLVVAVVSGLTFIANQHPAFYDTVLARWLLGLVTAVAVLLGIWDLAVSRTLIEMLGIIDPAQVPAAKVAAEALSVPVVPLVIVYVLTCAYAFCLWRFARHVRVKSDKAAAESRQGSQ